MRCYKPYRPFSQRCHHRSNSLQQLCYFFVPGPRQQTALDTCVCPKVTSLKKGIFSTDFFRLFKIIELLIYFFVHIKRFFLWTQFITFITFPKGNGRRAFTLGRVERCSSALWWRHRQSAHSGQGPTVDKVNRNNNKPSTFCSVQRRSLICYNIFGTVKAVNK